MGNLLFENQNVAGAIKYYEHALNLNENELQAIVGMGNVYYEEQNLSKAIEFYQKAI